MTPVTIRKVLATADADGICQSQSLGAAGTLTINGALATAGIANLVSQRRVAIVSGGDDSKRTATLYGTREGGGTINEAVSLTNAGTATTVLDFLTVGTVSVDGKIATTVTVGTNGTGSTPWQMPNFHIAPFNVDIQAQVTSTVTWNLETTLNDYWTAGRSNYDVTPQPVVTTILSGETVAAGSVLDTAVTGWRLTITNGTGTLAAQADQAGIVNY